MKFLLTALLILGARAAHADLYRWVDPQSGSVKFSSVPPPAAQPGVQVVPYRGSAAAPAKPESPAATDLDLRWRGLLAEISATPPGAPLLQPRLQEFVGLSAELDKADPAGAAHRHAEAESVLQRLLKVER